MEIVVTLLTDDVMEFPETFTVMPTSTETEPTDSKTAVPVAGTVTDDPELGTVGSERTIVYTLAWLR